MRGNPDVGARCSCSCHPCRCCLRCQHAGQHAPAGGRRQGTTTLTWRAAPPASAAAAASLRATRHRACAKSVWQALADHSSGAARAGAACPAGCLHNRSRQLWPGHAGALHTAATCTAAWHPGGVTSRAPSVVACAATTGAAACSCGRVSGCAAANAAASAASLWRDAAWLLRQEQL